MAATYIPVVCLFVVVCHCDLHMPNFSVSVVIAVALLVSPIFMLDCILGTHRVRLLISNVLLLISHYDVNHLSEWFNE